MTDEKQPVTVSAKAAVVAGNASSMVGADPEAHVLTTYKWGNRGLLGGSCGGCGWSMSSCPDDETLARGFSKHLEKINDPSVDLPPEEATETVDAPESDGEGT